MQDDGASQIKVHPTQLYDQMDHPVEVCAEGSDDPADEEDGVGDDEGGVPAKYIKVTQVPP